MSQNLDDDVLQPEPPCLFLSHRHNDSAIASVIREFVEARTAGGVRVYQSSSALAQGPRIGRELNKELVTALWTAGVVILIYTTPDQDWSWCMWECGVATHPPSGDTRTVLFQCAGAAPSLFAGDVRVNLRDIADVQKFTNELLTSPDFFPRLGRPTTQFQSNSPAVIQASQDLYERLRDVLPAPDSEPEEDWPPFPFIRLEVSLADVNSVLAAPIEEQLTLGKQLLLRDALITAADSEAGRLFGVRGVNEGTRFERLVTTWRDRTPTPGDRWVDALCSQLVDAMRNEFPTLVWELMRGADHRDGTWYAPALIRVRKVPRRGCMDFDVYFCKFAVDEKGAVKAGLAPG